MCVTLLPLPASISPPSLISCNCICQKAQGDARSNSDNSIVLLTLKMSQAQPRRPGADDQQQQPIKYGDLFDVLGDLAQKPIAPEDAAMMQTAEATIMGRTQKGGPAAVMQSAAARNEGAGFVGHRDVTDVAGDQGVTVTETDVPGRRIITESVGGQVFSLCFSLTYIV